MATDPIALNPLAEKLATELEGVAKHERVVALFDLTLACLFFWIAVLASIAAAVVGYFTESKQLVSVLAAAPALVMLIEQTFGFEARSDWHWEKSHRLNDIAGKIRFKSLSAANAFDEKTEFLKELGKKFPKLRAPFLRIKQS